MATARSASFARERHLARKVVSIPEAAKLLHFSRMYLERLIDEGMLSVVRAPYADNRGISRAQVVALKRKLKASQREGLTSMVDASRRIGLYDLEIKELPQRKR
jgi:excisionase family DNA binding protein